ncbi:MAG: OmpA family protein [Bacteroidetes bacterium]|nr:OmpA family protein [Bacteroidota bacterium]
MKQLLLSSMIVCAAIITGCASVPPPELVNARETYNRALNTPAAQLVPAEVHKAREALTIAERSFADDPKSYRTRDLAYVADRKARMAMALADIAAENAKSAKANSDYQATQTEILKNNKTDMAAKSEQVKNAQDDLAMQTEITRTTQQDLAASERSGDQKSEQLAAEKKARIDAEKRTVKALSDLAKLAAVKEESRGLVITLSGSVLFASNKSSLLPAAQSRLNQVTEALMATKERTLVVEGHTDSQGAADFNLQLSQQRADAVRDYIISRGYSSSLISAKGIGKERPVSDNSNVEGRANNRRVEIVVGKEIK